MESECPIFGEGCKKDTHRECHELASKYAKLIFCGDSRCLWYKDIEVKKYVKRHTDHTPFSNDYYQGICTRPEIALNQKIIDTAQMKHQLAVCAVRSDKTISGHLDWSKYPQGGNIPDPVDPSTAFHI